MHEHHTALNKNVKNGNEVKNQDLHVYMIYKHNSELIYSQGKINSKYAKISGSVEKTKTPLRV